MTCLVKKYYEKELKEYTGILGSESAAYYALAMNNGFTLDLDPLGRPSKLYQDLLAACGGNKIDAIKEKFIYYSQHYIKNNGDWTKKDEEPIFIGRLSKHNLNTTVLNVLCNDAYGEIYQSLLSEGVDDKEYAMRAAISRSKLAYLDYRESEYLNESRSKRIDKYNSRKFWLKVLGFFFSRYNKKLLNNPSSKDRQKDRREAELLFNSTVEYYILQNLKTELSTIIGTSPFAKTILNWIDKQLLDGNFASIDQFMSFLSVANTKTIILFDSSEMLNYAINMILELNIDLYKDGIKLFGDRFNLISAINKLLKNLSSEQEDYVKNFVSNFNKDFVNQLKTISNDNISQAALMWQCRSDRSLLNMNQDIYQKIKSGFESRLISIQKSSKNNRPDVLYTIKSRLKKMELYNVDTNDGQFALYSDFLDTAFTELRTSLVWLELQSSNVKKLSAEDLMYFLTDVLGFYTNIINEHLSNLNSDNTNLNQTQLKKLHDKYFSESDKNYDIGSLLSECIKKYNSLIDDYCDIIIDDYVDDNLTLGETEVHKRTFKAMLRGEINKGNLMFAENFLGDATQSGSNIIRMISNMLNNDDREVIREGSKVGNKLNALYTKVEPLLSRLGVDYKNFMKNFCELDARGLPTGYFVRGIVDEKGKYVGINYGQFEQDRREFELGLRNKYKLLSDSHGNTIWNFDIRGEEATYNKYMDELDDWLDMHCERQFKAEYYKQRRRILGRQASLAIDVVLSLIKLLLEKCTDDNGFVYTFKLTPSERKKLIILRHQIEEMSTPYEVVLDDSGKMMSFKKKSGERLEIAESILKWNQYVSNHIKRKPDWDKFNKARELLSDEQKVRFDEDNLSRKLTDEFYELLSQCSTSTQSEEFMKVSALRNKILGFTKNKQGYYLPDLFRLTDEAWLELKNIDQLRALLRTSGSKGSVEFDKIAAKYWVTMEDPTNPGQRIAVYDFLYRLAVASGTLNEFYDKYHYTVLLKNGAKRYVPLSVFLYLGPKDSKFIEQSPINGYSALADNSDLVNENFVSDSSDRYQPKISKYKNDLFTKLMDNEDAKNFYEYMLLVMEDAISMLPKDANASKYKMPQITASSCDIASRNLEKMNITGALKSMSLHFTINENDDDLYREDLAIRPDGSPVETIPIRYVSTLEDPSLISCNIVKTVTQFYMMALNFKLKSLTVPVCNTLISKMRGGFSQTSATNNDQVKRAQLEVTMYGYGRKQKGLGDETLKMSTTEKRITKFLNNTRVISLLALLAWNVFSATKGFVSASYNTLTDAAVGRYYDRRDRYYAMGQMLKCIVPAISGIGNSKAMTKIQAALIYNGAADNIVESLDKRDKIKARRIFDHFVPGMGIFTLGDYTTNALIMTSLYHATRLVENPITHLLLFMTEEECIDAFIKSGKSEKQAIDYFELHRNNHLFNMYDLSENGDFSIKDKVTIEIDGKSYEIDPHKYVTKNVENRLAGTLERRASIANGVMSEHGKGGIYRGALTRFLVVMRGYLFSQGWDRLKGLNGYDDFNNKYYDRGLFREFNSTNLMFRGYYDFETGHCEPGVYSSLILMGKHFKSFSHDVALAIPIINRMLHDLNRQFKKSDMQNIHKFMLDVCGIATFGVMCSLIFIPKVREYPDDWLAQFLATVSMGCMIETSTPVNPATIGDLISTVTTTLSYLKNVASVVDPLADMLGLADYEPTDYVRSGPYKDKPRWFRDVMKAFMKPTGLTGLYETFTPIIPGLDNPKSIAKYQQERLNNTDENYNMFNIPQGGITQMMITPRGLQSKYDWYIGNTIPATLLPRRKDPDEEEEEQTNNGLRTRRRARRKLLRTR